jgi:hypothetical protein
LVQTGQLEFDFEEQPGFELQPKIRNWPWGTALNGGAERCT